MSISNKWIDADKTKFGFHLHIIPYTIKRDSYQLPTHALQIWCLWGQDMGLHWKGRNLLSVRLSKREVI